MLQNTKKMGNKPHHSAHYGGGVDLSKGKTPHDSFEKYMPVDDKGSSILKVGKPYEMGMSMRGPLDKHGKKKGAEKVAANMLPFTVGKGPLHKNLVSMKNGETETEKETGKAPEPNVKSAAEENMKGQVLKNKVEKFMTSNVENAAKKQ